jgi:hypothetical protein
MVRTIPHIVPMSLGRFVPKNRLEYGNLRDVLRMVSWKNTASLKWEGRS